MRRKIILVILISIMIISTIFIGVNSANVNQIEKVANEARNTKANEATNQMKSAVTNAVADKEKEEQSSQSSKQSTQEKAEKSEANTEEAKGKEVEKKEENKAEKAEEKKEEDKVSEEKTETKAESMPEYDLIYSNKYLVKGRNINRIPPKTSIEEFKKNIEVEGKKGIKIYKGEKEVKSGYIGTGMVVKGEEGEEYTVSVIGDITGDGIANQVELTMIIRHLIDLKGWELEGIEAESADISRRWKNKLSRH